MIDHDQYESTYVPATTFNRVSEAHEQATVAMLGALDEMDRAKDMMEVTSAQVELSVIQDAGGNEKQVASTEAARNRLYDIARSKSTAYLTARDHYFSARNDYRYHQAMVRRFDLHLQFIIANIRAETAKS